MTNLWQTISIQEAITRLIVIKWGSTRETNHVASPHGQRRIFLEE